MTHPGIPYDDFRNELLNDPEFKKGYDSLAPQFELIGQIIEARITLGLSQSELAQRCNTTQSIISRLEKGTYNPSLSFMQKVAEGLGKTLSVQLH